MTSRRKPASLLQPSFNVLLPGLLGQRLEVIVERRWITSAVVRHHRIAFSICAWDNMHFESLVFLDLALHIVDA